jgi:peptide/nickel transport system ATP-binding protein
MVEIHVPEEPAVYPRTISPKMLLDVHHLKMWFPHQKGFFGQNVSYVKAVDDVSFYIRRGETLGLVGESGCGKTTIGRCIVRAYKPTAGEILYYSEPEPTGAPQDRHTPPPGEDDSAAPADPGDGHAVDLALLERKELRQYRQSIRMIFQDPYSSLNPRMSVFEIVAEVLRVNHLASGSALEDRVAQLLRRVGLLPEYMRRYPHAFSGGERQRIGIARALATNPRLIVADEAISALDVSIRAQILNLMEDLQAEFGLTYLFIAHDLSVIRHICDRVNVMYVGKLVESADATTLYAFPRHPYTEALMSAVPIHNPRLRDKERRIRLEGDVADPANPPSGCYFHPRCRYAQERCAHEEPQLRPIESRAPGGSGGDHFVSCHFAEELHLRGIIAEGRVAKEGSTGG